jgi:hypothetical protein
MSVSLLFYAQLGCMWGYVKWCGQSIDPEISLARPIPDTDNRWFSVYPLAQRAIMQTASIKSTEQHLAVIQ